MARMTAIPSTFRAFVAEIDAGPGYAAALAVALEGPFALRPVSDAQAGT